jgi:hypothetical protein
MTITEILQKIHVRYEHNTDYPSTGSEDFVSRLAYIDDALDEWEQKALSGALFPELKSSASFSATGSGSDPLLSDFLVFIRAKEKPAVIKSGTTQYTEVSMSDGNQMVSEGQTTGNYFWVEGGNIRTLPAITGTITFPYIRKATRYPLGTESTPIELKIEKYLMNYALAQLFLDDGDLNKYQAKINMAQEALESMENLALIAPPEDSSWGFGM